jgi:RNA polymerase sigma-70 factor (ECF subfamily)
VITCLEVIGMDVAATCAALGMSAVAVRVTRHRGLKRLRRLLGEAPQRDRGHPVFQHGK